MRSGIGLLLAGIIGVVALMLFSRKSTPISRPFDEASARNYAGDVTDRAVAGAIESGVAWADYWTKQLNSLYESVGNMPITGPLVTCIAAPCYGTSRPQSP